MSGTPSAAVRSRHLAAVCAIAAAGLCAAACADVGRALTFGGNEVNVESPVAPAAIAATRVSYVTPRFTEVPPKPINAPSPGQIKQRVQGQEAERATLDRWVARHPQMTGDTEGFADTGRAQAAKGGSAPVEDRSAAAEAWAAQVRAAAAPPPPPQ